MAPRIERYATTRFWAVFDGDELICVTVYKKGARAVQRRLAAQPPRQPLSGSNGEIFGAKKLHLHSQ